MSTKDDEKALELKAIELMSKTLCEVEREFIRAIKKHGIYKTPANPAMPNAERLVILVEEVGEVARAMTYDESDASNLWAELVQTAAMAAASVVGNRLLIERDNDDV